MIVFRLSKTKYAKDLSGKGSETSGGRWNSKGTALVYTSISKALCTIEIAVHTPLGNIPADYQIISIEIPDDVKIPELKTANLPQDWKTFPYSHSTQEIGDNFVASGKYLAIKVPSAVVDGEFNYLLNPDHPGFTKIKIKLIEPFSFDKRLFIK